MKRSTLLYGCALLLAVLTGTRAHADVPQLFIGGYAVAASHSETNDARERLGLGQAPIVAARANVGDIEFDAHVVPVGQVHFASPFLPKNDAAGYSAGEARYWMFNHRLGVAVGESLFFERIDYGSSMQGVRSAGARYGLYGRFPIAAHSALTVGLADSPQMHDRFTIWSPPGSPYVPRTFFTTGTRSFSDCAISIIPAGCPMPAFSMRHEQPRPLSGRSPRTAFRSVRRASGRGAPPDCRTTARTPCRRAARRS